jgi:cell division inhibitor SepF
MGAMYRLKAYFGMVPADELGDYVDYVDDVDYIDDVEPRHPSRRRGEGWEERAAEPERGRHGEGDEPRGGWDRGRPPVRSVAHAVTARTEPASARPRTAGPVASAGAAPAVQGALAVDRDPDPEPAPERVRAQPESARQNPLARITTLQPRSYNEARTIGERYREGIPVIMNLTELDDAAAKRLVDFAAGLAFALRGSIDKVTSRVFLLTPPEVEVSADDARMLAERSRLFGDR